MRAYIPACPANPPSFTTHPKMVHLFVLVHGMEGSASHLSELGRVMEEKYRSQANTPYYVHIAQSIKGELTFDGIDWCGERVAKEVRPTFHVHIS